MKRPRSLSLFRRRRQDGAAGNATETATPESPDEQATSGDTSGFDDPDAADLNEPPRRRGWFSRRNAAKPSEPGPAADGLPVGDSSQLRELEVQGTGADNLFEIDDQGRLVENGRKRYAVGLLWLPYDYDKSVAEQAKDAGFGDDAPDLYTVLGDREQIGFGYSYNGLKHGTPVAATLFSPELLPGNWLAIFQLDSEIGSSWWLIARRDDAIYEDRIISDESDARGSFAALMEAPNWSVTICPREWNIPDSKDYTLGTVLAKRVRARSLQSTNRLRALTPLLYLVVALAVLGGVGYVAWEFLKPAPPPPPAPVAAPPPVIVPPPWVGMPTTEDFADSCERLFEDMLLQVTGWSLRPLVCRIEGESGARRIVAQEEWSRIDGGRLSFLLAALRDKGVYDVGLSEDRRSATIFSSVAVGPDVLPEELAPLSPQEIQQRLGLRFDTLTLDLRLRLVAPNANQRNPGSPQAAVWSYHELTLSPRTPLDEYLMLISDIPAAVPERIEYNVNEQTWLFVIRLYHPRR